MSNTRLYTVEHGARIGMVATIFDTRDDAELAGDPSLAVLTAITSLHGARQAIARTDYPLVDLVYLLGKAQAAPEPLILALRATGAKLSVASAGTDLTTLPPPELALLDVIDVAMSGLTEATLQRLEIDDPRGALRLLAHEPLPDRGTNKHEPEYWGRAFEWIALLAAAVEERPGFGWCLAPRAGAINQLGTSRFIANHPLAPFDVAVGEPPVPLELPELVERSLATGDFDPLLALVG